MDIQVLSLVLTFLLASWTAWLHYKVAPVLPLVPVIKVLNGTLPAVIQTSVIKDIVSKTLINAPVSPQIPV